MSVRTVLVAHPSADVYGADLQLLESITGLVDRGYRTIVTVPADGPLTTRLRERGAEVIFTPAPVLRRSALSPTGIISLIGSHGVGSVRLARLIRRVNADVVYVNTVTIPVWIAAARLARRPVLCHVHEAEDADRGLLLKALLAPLIAAHLLVVNSKAAATALTSVYPRLSTRTSLIYNGIPDPPVEPAPPTRESGSAVRIGTVARLSPRKGQQVALEAIALLREDGHDVQYTLYGTPFTGYEWFEQQLRDRAAQPDLAGAVHFAGYVAPIWSALADCDLVAAPSLREPFGNAVVEAQFAARPVVAAAAMGHLETVADGDTGLLVTADDPGALADGLRRLIVDPELAARLATAGRASAEERFSVERYQQQIALAVDRLERERSPGAVGRGQR